MKGHIYKITSANTDKIYIGSTTDTLKKRMGGHMSAYQKYQKYQRTEESVYMTSFKVIEHGEVAIELIEEYEIEDRYELYIYEDEWINKNKDIVVNERKASEIKNKRIKCECGISYNVHCKNSHNRSKKHYNFVYMRSLLMITGQM